MKKHSMLLMFLPLILCSCKMETSDEYIIGGSDTKYAKVYSIQKHDGLFPMYQWFVFDTEGNVLQTGTTELCPVFHEEDGVVILTLSSPPYVSFYQCWQQTFSLESGEISDRYIPEETPDADEDDLKLYYKHGWKLQSGTEYAEIYDISMHDCSLYQWFVLTAEGHVLDSGVSSEKPEFTEQNDTLTICVKDNSGTLQYRDYAIAENEISEWRNAR